MKTDCNATKTMCCFPSIRIFLTLTLLLAILQIAYSASSEEDIKSIALSNDNSHFERVLKAIIKPRIVGTEGHGIVKKFIVNELKQLNFNVELDSFNENVPIFNNVTFTNIVGKLNSEASEYLTLACHYDSKYFPGEVFQGAVDSAVPCAIMLNLAKTLQSNLLRIQNRTDISLMLIFFDGEEAFKSWTDTDSLYGSRHLARKWLKKPTIRSIPNKANELERISVMILLDLIGAANPRFFSFYENTEALHERLTQIEEYLTGKQLLDRGRTMFLRRSEFAGIDDDHKPFLKNNVPILHLIPVPFPKVWHTIDDNLQNLDARAIRKFNSVFRVFVADFLTSFNSGVNFRI